MFGFKSFKIPVSVAVLIFGVIAVLPFFQNCAPKNSESVSTDAGGGLLVANDEKIENADHNEKGPNFKTSAQSQWTTIFSQNFEKNSIGIYTGSSLSRDFGSYALQTNRGVTKGGGGTALEKSKVRAEIVKGFKDSKSLKIKLPKNVYGYDDSGASWMVPISVSNEVSLQFELFLSRNFQGRGGKIIGLRGGDAGTGGREPDGYNGWSARINWWEISSLYTLVSYVYHIDQKERPSNGDAFFWNCNSTSFCTKGLLDIKKFRNRWNLINYQVKMNTVGAKNGEVKVLVNGLELSRRVGLDFRKTNKLAIDKLFVNVFSGGNDSRYAPTEDMYVIFDNIKVLKKNN